MNLQFALLLSEVKKLSLRVNSLEKRLRFQPQNVGDKSFLVLADHLRDTYLAVLECGGASASQISVLTGRSRAVCSSYANQLVLLGWLVKTCVGRRKVFVVVQGVGLLGEVSL
jgi:hypothetical protein